MRILLTLLLLGQIVFPPGNSAIKTFPITSPATTAPARPPWPVGNSLDTDLEGYWPLEETTGNRLDIIGTNHFTPSNTPGSVTGKLGNAASFDSVAQSYMTSAVASAAIQSAAWTVALWVYVPAVLPASKLGIAQANTSSGVDSYRITFSPSGANVSYFSTISKTGFSGFFANTTISPRVEGWHSVVASYNDANNTATITIDGVFKEVACDRLPIIMDAPLSIGRLPAPVTQYYTVNVDEIAIWSRTLTQAEQEAVAGWY